MRKYLILVLFFVALAFVGAGCGLGSQKQTAGTPPQNVASTQFAIGEVDTSDWLRYTNEEYGFSLRYPAAYKEDKHYAIWTAENSDVHLLDEWGVNKGQESIFVISVYPKKYELAVLDYYDHKIFDESVVINGKTANSLKVRGAYNGYLFRNNEYIFIVYSSLSGAAQTDEYKDYLNILNTLELVEK